MTDENKQPPEGERGESSEKPAAPSEKPEPAFPSPPAARPAPPERAGNKAESPPAAASGEKADAPAAPHGESASAETKPPPAAPAKPSAPAAGAPQKPAAPARPATPPAPRPVVKPEPWSSPLIDELKKKFPGAITDPLIFRGQPYFTVAKESLIEVSEFLKSSEGGAYTYLVDETAVDYPKKEKRFEIIYILYSHQRNDRLRMKVLAGEGEGVPSVVRVWTTANWLEREVFDMFGVRYEGHPELKRILLPDDWVGHPLRKNYDILKQDDAWVQANLGIKSGQ